MIYPWKSACHHLQKKTVKLLLDDDDYIYIYCQKRWFVKETYEHLGVGLPACIYLYMYKQNFPSLVHWTSRKDLVGTCSKHVLEQPTKIPESTKESPWLDLFL